MIDFKKRLNSKDESKKVNPIEIYASLDRAADKGPLRPAQQRILSSWFEKHKEDRDIIIKLHTGQGKTLIGLLLLQSYLNQGKGPVMYICPDKYLVDQTCSQAKQFGIDYVTIDSDGDIPDEFYDSKSILIVHVQKVFNGFTKFGLGNRSIEVAAIVLDDSHACISSIEDSANIRITRGGDLYSQILSTFEDYLKDQGLAVFKEVLNGESYDVVNVPYWAWTEKYEQLVQIFLDNIEEVDKFSWNLIKDELKECRCLISSKIIEIYPLQTPIYKYKFFDKASHRILMSATTNNDAAFIKALGIDKKAILNPLVDEESKWSGEKMILIPYYIDPNLDRTAIVTWLAKEKKGRKYGIIALTPSNSVAEYWENLGAIKATSTNMFNLVEGLKSGVRDRTVVFSNRYDGIDLPDSSCRILILDERPFSQTLFDLHQEEVRGSSDSVNIKIAQKIEQGLGRGVRGEKDYCIIVLNGTKLIASIKDRKLRKFFSPQTRKQVEIGLELTKYAVQDSISESGSEILNGAMKQCLARDEGWKAFYSEQMDSINYTSKDSKILDILEIEAEAERLFMIGDFNKAKDKYQYIIDSYLDDDAAEKGWYLQEMARSIYPVDKSKSNIYQSSAHKINHYLMKPPSGLEIVQLKIEGERTSIIKKWIESFDDYTNLKIQLDDILSGLVFGPNYKEFEKALEKLGKILGFGSEQPELEWKEGPDNLWCVGPNKYIVIECKSGVKEDRDSIAKSEAEQLLHSIEWFKRNYPKCEFTPLLIIPTRNLDRGITLSKESKILRKGKLNTLKKQVVEFFGEFKRSDFSSISIDNINGLLNTHHLNENDIIDLFENPYYQK
ncbi:MAG: DEAD/DEAH box helicase family protein [Saprospiraceae bacterium]